MKAHTAMSARASVARAAADVSASMRLKLLPFHTAAGRLDDQYVRWGMLNKTPPVLVRAHAGAKSAEDVRAAIMQMNLGPAFKPNNAIMYHGITQNLAGLWRATTLYLKYDLVVVKKLPLAEGALVRDFERSVEQAMADLKPKSMHAISTVFDTPTGQTEWMSLAVETKEGEWFSINGPHHHPWGTHIHDTWAPPAEVMKP